MFTISFRTGKAGELVPGAKPEFSEERIFDPYNSIDMTAPIGQYFTDFLSGENPYSGLFPDMEEIDASYFFDDLKLYIDLCIEDSALYTESVFMFFAFHRGVSIPAFSYEFPLKEGHENDAIEDYCPVKTQNTLEQALRGFLAASAEVYDVPLAVYTGQALEDVCMASLHFMITHKINIRKCKNCGKYFVAYNRSDTIYCDRMSPFNTSRTCKEDGRLRTYIATVSADELKKKIRNTTVALRMRVKRNPDNQEYKDYFDSWMAQLKVWKQNYKNGAVSEEQFMEWLNQALH